MGDFIGIVIGSLLAGIIIGPLARLVLPGKQNVGLFTTILIGAAGAFAGSLVYQAFGGSETGGIDWILHAVQIAVGAAGLVAYLSLTGRK